MKIPWRLNPASLFLTAREHTNSLPIVFLYFLALPEGVALALLFPPVFWRARARARRRMTSPFRWVSFMIAGSPWSYSRHTQTHRVHSALFLQLRLLICARADNKPLRCLKPPCWADIHRIWCYYLNLDRFCQLELLCHHVWGSAVQRGEDERLRSRQRRQPDVLQLRAPGHELVFRGVTGEKTPKTRPDRQS